MHYWFRTRDHNDRQAASPETNRTSDNAPSHRVLSTLAPLVEALQRGRDYLLVKLDDPSFNTPTYANLFDDEGGETFGLIWSRGRRANGSASTNIAPPGAIRAGVSAALSVHPLHA